jgi:hypothetical protein
MNFKIIIDNKELEDLIIFNFYNKVKKYYNKLLIKHKKYLSDILKYKFENIDNINIIETQHLCDVYLKLSKLNFNEKIENKINKEINKIKKRYSYHINSEFNQKIEYIIKKFVLLKVESYINLNEARNKNKQNLYFII